MQRSVPPVKPTPPSVQTIEKGHDVFGWVWRGPRRLVLATLLILTGCNSLLGIDSDADIKAIRKTAEETCAPYAKFGELEHMKCVDREYSWRVNAAYGR